MTAVMRGFFLSSISRIGLTADARAPGSGSSSSFSSAGRATWAWGPASPKQASTSGCTAGSAWESSSTRVSIVRGRREHGDQGLRLIPMVCQRVARRKSCINARVTECLDQVSPCERGALVFQVQHNALARLDIRTPQRLENRPLLKPRLHFWPGDLNPPVDRHQAPGKRSRVEERPKHFSPPLGHELALDSARLPTLD